MSVVCLLEVPTKTEFVETMKNFLKEIVRDTRTYEGCEKILVYNNIDDPTNIVIYEIWKSRGHHERYVKWRFETGVGQKILSMSTADSLNPKYYDLVDA
ncbi:MAG: antibiotic biosynthesis monooxygenase [Nitrosopumilus sp.]|nr:antibiotic biosynthesis monooxygenase [Nitrosopumilus sp.]NNL58816.1 antibiotic biosynthesis monooxygenase [Nitrosopumilus sp.]